MKTKIVIGLLAVCFIFGGTYVGYSEYLDKKVETMKPLEETEIQEGVAVSEVSVILSNGDIKTLEEFNEMSQIETIVDVSVSYEDGTHATKPAYVSFEEDTTEPRYEDSSLDTDKYGRVILPSREDEKVYEGGGASR